ncbi:hypothetical protein DY000_02034840 [Brassica cretica]|uniref:Uncharacterized protein n=1 Tax=Brassica cretica TaxID=69181 RepID=A0ABQ7DK89_BRACR|nr:hypothetical protein DY000_02034840 [Brassica cretica]
MCTGPSCRTAVAFEFTSAPDHAVINIFPAAQEPVETQQHLGSVKDWISSRHLKTLELTNVLSNFPDISIALTEELHNILDGEANQTIAVRKLIQEVYMEDSSSRCLGLLSQYSILLSFVGHKAASLMPWISTRKARVNSDGVANALIQHQWRPKSFIFVCSLPETWDVAVTTSNNPKADFGMAHQVLN